MIAVKDYLARQLSGLRIMQVAEGISQAFNRYIPYLSYISSVSLDTAQEKELEQLGTIIGYSRPLVPNSIILDKVFTFTAIAAGKTFSETGFSGTSVDGGNFSPVNLVLDSNKMSIAQYKEVLRALAQLKWGKFSILSIDTICQVFHPTYDITYTSDKDILIRFKELMSKGLEAWYKMDNIPEIPDDPAGVTYLQDAWANVDGWNSGGTISVSDGMLHSTGTGYFLSYDVTKGLGRGAGVTSVKIKLRQNPIVGAELKLDYIIDSTGVTATASCSGVISNDWVIFTAEITDCRRVAGIYWSGYYATPSDTDIDFIYIGTGAYLPNSLLDSSGNANHGTIYGATPDGEGGLMFDGVNDYCYALYSPHHVWSKNVWFKKSLQDSNPRFIQASIVSWPNNGDGLYVANTNVSCDISNGTHLVSLFTSAPLLNEWYMVTIVYHGYGNSAELYLNGILVDTESLSAFTSDPTPTQLWIGRQLDYYSFNGTIRSPRIYNRAMSAEEVKYLYDNPGINYSISNTNLYLANSIFDQFFNSTPRVVAARVS